MHADFHVHINKWCLCFCEGSFYILIFNLQSIPDRFVFQSVVAETTMLYYKKADNISHVIHVDDTIINLQSSPVITESLAGCPFSALFEA